MQNQLAAVQLKYEQQHNLLVSLQTQQQQQWQHIEQCEIEPAPSSTAAAPSNDPQQVLQQQQLEQDLVWKQQQLAPQLQHAEAQQLAVSVPATSGTVAAPSQPAAAQGLVQAAVAPTTAVAAAAEIEDDQHDDDYAASMVASMVDSSLTGTSLVHDWDSGSAPSSKPAGRRSAGWFGMWGGRRNSYRAPSRSALV